MSQTVRPSPLLPRPAAADGIVRTWDGVCDKNATFAPSVLKTLAALHLVHSAGDTLTADEAVRPKDSAGVGEDMLRKSHFALVKASLENSAIVLPKGFNVPPARYEAAMIAAIDNMLAEGRRMAKQAPAPKRSDRPIGTVH